MTDGIVKKGTLPELEKIVKRYYQSGTPLGIVCSGGIASGKTTMANTVAYFLGLPVIHENFRKNPFFFGKGGYLEKLLTKAYEDGVFQKSQSWFIRSKAQQIFDRIWRYGIGYSGDRAPDGDKPFFDNLKTQGFINQEQYNFILQVFNNSLKRLSNYLPSANIINVAEPSVLKERSDSRAKNDDTRKEELDYPIEYFASLAPLFSGMAEVWRERGTLIENNANTSYRTIGQKDETRFEVFPEKLQYALAKVLEAQYEIRNNT